MIHTLLIKLLLLILIFIPGYCFADNDDNNRYQRKNEFGTTSTWQWTDDEINNAVARPFYYFTHFDSNYDAIIDKGEFDRADVDKAQLKSLSDYDTDKNGLINTIEFAAFNKQEI